MTSFNSSEIVTVTPPAPSDKDGSSPSGKDAFATLEVHESKIRKNLKAFLEVGASLMAIRDNHLYRAAGFDTFESYCMKRLEFTRQRAYQLIGAAKVTEHVNNGLQQKGAIVNEAQARELIDLEPEQQLEVCQKAMAEADNGKLTARQIRAAKVKIVPATPVEKAAAFNRTNDNIDWAKWSWNPQTGCEHGCEPCAAKCLAEGDTKTYPNGFRPHWRPERLEAPANTKIPEKEKSTPGIKNVFVCSMGDLFGSWVPQEQIDQVLAKVRENTQWNFLFLTKNPSRMVGIEWPNNAWVGTTVDRQARVDPAVEAFQQIKATVKFLSCAPLLEELTFPTMDSFDWIIIGAQSATKDVPEVQPEPQWVQSLMKQAWEAGRKVYCKPNLRFGVKEFPEPSPP